MVRHTSSLRTMLLVILACQFAIIHLTWAENACIGHPTFREPANSDIQVFCGSETVELEILLCPIYFLGYEESMLALNSEYSNNRCKGRPDWKMDPPVVRFSFSITQQAIAVCSSKLTVIEEVGTGAFTDFSSVQFINVSGTVTPHNLNSGVITYQEYVMYKFSCRYPLQYLVNNTEISVTGVNLAIRDNNGSFISALSMRLYSDRHYSSMLQIPPGGMDLKTRIYVEVKASNLTNRFSVLLDRCYATPSPFPLNITCHNLFVGCDRDCQTIIGVNGEKQEARFSFETFRFVQNQDSPISTYYIHCATRLCVNAICPKLVQSCNASTALRRRRSVDNKQATTVSDTATVSSGPITTRLDSDNLLISGGAEQSHLDSTMLVVSLVAGILSVFCLTLLAFIVYHISKANIRVNKTMLYPKE